MLKRLFTPPESRSITFQKLFEMGEPLPSGTRAGVNINQDTAFKISVVYAATRLIADVCSTLPLDAFYRSNGQRFPFRPKPAWVSDPEPDAGFTRIDHYQAMHVSLATDGNSFSRKTFDSAGNLSSLSIMDPRRVRIDRDSRHRIVFIVDGQTTLTEDDVVHITDLRRPGQLRGVSRIHELRETLGLTKALEEFSAAFFGSGSTTSGVIEVPGEVTEQQAEALQDGWEKGHRGLRKAHRPGVLSAGAKWVKTGVDNDQAQMLGSREFMVEEVCRIYRIPPHLLQSTKPGSMSYASVEELSKAFVTYTVLPLVSKIEDAYSKLLPGGAFLKFNVDGLLRASLADRYAAYSVGTQAGFLAVNDVRRLEDLPAVEGGDANRVPLANVDLHAAGLTEQQMKVAQAAQLINAGFDPEAALAAVGLPSIAHTGLATVQLQQEPAPVRELEVVAEERVSAQDVADAIGSAIRELPGPVVNVTVPEPSVARTKRVERDDAGNITAIVEE
jgi:HK97 family phage portal protein